MLSFETLKFDGLKLLKRPALFICSLTAGACKPDLSVNAKDPLIIEAAPVTAAAPNEAFLSKFPQPSPRLPDYW